MATTSNIEERTLKFIEYYNELKNNGDIKSDVKLAEILGLKASATITEIKNKRQNITPEIWKKFKEYYRIDENSISIIKPDKNKITQVRKSNGKGLDPYYGVDFCDGNSNELNRCEKFRLLDI